MSLSKSVQEPCVEQALASSRKGTVFFPFKLPKNGLALRSVSIAGGVAKLHFVASSKVPTISEQDVATAFRLAKEDKRPCFFYYPFPFSHPLHTSRFFMKWFPAWLKETGIGELLAGADWNMKCLHVGVRTNKEKTVFKSWPKSSNLQGLATKLDFPTNDTFISTSIMMSCDHAKVQKSDNEIYFPEEPSMKITDETNSLYSKYITEIYRSVGYHDEPLLLKMQELIKLILAVEWLYKEKGVRVDEDWMTKHTCSPKDPIKVAAQVEFSKRKEPPYDMIPRLDVYKRPSSDVTVKTWEAEMYRRLETKHRVNRCYGYYNNAAGELIMFREDGEAGMHIPLNCLKLDVKHNMMMIEASVCSYSPFPAKLPLMAEIREKILPSLLKHSCETTSFPLPVSVDTTVDGSTSDEEMELKLVRLLQPSPQLSLPPLKQTTDMRATVVSYDKVFASVDPNQPLVPPVPGIREGIVPKVESWSELVSEWSVPIPRIWQVPFVGVGEPAASGGVTTQNFTVQKEQLQESVAYNEIQRSGNYTSSANMITVEAQQANSAAQQRVEEIPRRRNRRKRNRSHRTAEAQRNNATIELVDDEVFAEVSAEFCEAWIQSRPKPQITNIFVIDNPALKQKWERYASQYQCNFQDVEKHYHGTRLRCDIISSRSPCPDPNCGICGILCSGPDLSDNSDDAKRFGPGFYLAPNSSKAHDYTRSLNNYKAILLCKVHPGKKYILKDTCPDLTAPPSDYNSIFYPGQFGDVQNYPELVVYNSDAVIPCYIIVYQEI